MDALRFFATHSVFTLSDFEKHSAGEGRTKNPATQKSLLAYHRRRGHILSLRRGLYAAVPPEATADTYTADAYLITARLTMDAVLAYGTALAYHGLAHSAHQTFYCLSSVSKFHPLHFQGSTFRAVPPPRALSEADALTIGVEEGDRQGMRLRVTGLERTLVDALDRTALCGGWEEVWNSLTGIDAYLDFDLLTRYALLLNNATTAAKVGHFLEQRKQELSVPEKTLKTLREHRPKQPHYVERRGEGAKRESGCYFSEWNLMVPPLSGDLDYEGADL